MSVAPGPEHPAVSNAVLDQLFLQARTYTAWLPEPVPESTLRELYNLLRFGPTSANTQPGRFVFLIREEAKARLLPALAASNREKSRTAPVVVLVAWDNEFYDHLPRTFPHKEMRPTFANNPKLAQETAFRNGSLQAGYLILAARALGLDCGPMSGFDAAKVNAEFFPDGKWQINLVCNLGHGNRSALLPRNPRLEFEEACRIL
jgi:3-hydroxypropanoate dehydrogenase